MNTGTSSALYQKIITAPLKVKLTDIFGGAFKKHDATDSDYAMIAGTSLDTVTTEIGMLQKWQQPWMFVKVLIVGLVVSVISLGAVLALMLLFGYSAYPCLNILFIVIAPCVMPITLMVFFWEMNVPRDISIMKMVGYFFTGGVLSLVITALFNTFVPSGIAPLAAVVEEPAKLLASIFFLKQIYQKKGKVYGFTGLAIGAAVGAGFAAFESIQYAINCLPTVAVDVEWAVVPAQVMVFTKEWLPPVLVNVLLRFFCAVCSHVLYCAPYSCIAALNMEQYCSVKKAVREKRFLTVFAVSVLCHAFWNTNTEKVVILLIKFGIVIPVLWVAALYGIRKSFAQIVGKLQLSTGNSNAVQFMIKGTKGVHAGIAFSVKKAEILVGTDPSCQLTYPVNVPGIEKKHCKFVQQNGGLYLADLGTSEGTYLNHTRLKPMTGYLLKSGDQFALGTNGQEFEVL